jgi:spore coat polysaccharide biosynthesis predicted glycosyltransferase SpsG
MAVTTSRQRAAANGRADVGGSAPDSGHGRVVPITPRMTVVFRVAAGPRVGFGHLVRCRSLARALGVAPAVSIRGTAATRRRARQLGWRVLPGGLRDLARRRPAVLVIDDPGQAAAAAWVRTARRLGIAVASIHDLGLAPVPADLSIDGSVGRTANCGRRARLRGPRFAVLDPGVATARRHSRPADARPRVLVALGGGARGQRHAVTLGRALTAAHPLLEVRVASGFTAASPGSGVTRVRRVWAPNGLAGELHRATVAIVAGGVTLYEACALGVPVVATAVTAPQAATIRAMSRAGAAVSGGRLDRGRDARRVAAAATALLDDALARRTLGRRGRALVDGHGAWRVAAAVRRLVDAA